MPLTEAVNTSAQAAQIAQSMFAPATNVLSNALNNAVDMGRRMVDLQSHQEDMFLSERDKLRLANERKGLEARRIFENDRNFGEDVLRDRRNFEESIFQDRRDFSLQSEMQRANLGLAQQRLGIDEKEFLLKKENLAAQNLLLGARADYYKAGAAAGGAGRSRASTMPKGGGSFLTAFRDRTYNTQGPFSFSQPPANTSGLAISPDQQATAQQPYVLGQQIVKDLSVYDREEAKKDYQYATPEERQIMGQIIPLLPEEKSGRAEAVKIPNVLGVDPAKRGGGF